MVKKLDIIKVDKGDLIYYYVICPRCGNEIRAHQKGQVKFNLGLHKLSCTFSE